MDEVSHFEGWWEVVVGGGVVVVFVGVVEVDWKIREIEGSY